MSGDRRLIPLVALLASLSACQRDADGDTRSQRSADTADTPRSTKACTPNGRVPAITSGGIGVARIGGSVREVGQSCSARDTSFTLSEGIQEQGAVIEFAGHRVLAIIAGDGTISRLIVADHRSHWRGLGVGSTVGQLRQPTASLRSVGEGRSPFG